MSHKQIVVMDEPESTTLAQEYEHLPDLMEFANHEDDYSLVGKVPARDVLFFGNPQEHLESLSSHKERDLSGFNSLQGLESEVKMCEATKANPERYSA